MTIRLTVTPRVLRVACSAAVAFLAAQAALAQPVAGPVRSPLAPSAGDARRFHAALEATRFRALLDSDWEWRLQQDPEWATSLGDHRFDDRLADASPEAVARRHEHQRTQLKALRKVDVDALTGEDRISYDCALQQAQLAVDWQRFPAMDTRVLSAKDGVQIDLPQAMADFPVRNELDARHALARLQAMPARIAQDVAWLREGKRLGWVTFKSSLSQVPDQIDQLLARPLIDTPLLDPFRRLPADMPADRRTALQDQAASVLQAQVAPAFAELRKVVVDELLPASPEDGALSAYPDGVEVYRLSMRSSTTLALDARAVHEIGVAEMARIQGQIAAVMKSVGFEGSRAEFVDQMAGDPKFFYASGDELLAGYRELAKRIDPELTKLFLTLPRAPYGIRAIPAFHGANTAESYSEGAADDSTPGWFNANVVALAQRPRWGMVDLFLHEAVPGHHLQVSRAHELSALPMFRRTSEFTAYTEGWALYAEDLGDDLGLYADPATRYGWLHAQAWRAARMVVDTGIHAMGWTRTQAIDYMVDSAGLPRPDAEAEVDRYYVWPGQALGYKLGELQILKLRKAAHDALGERFDLRAFNQEVIDHGALPLPVLERVITAWIARVRSAPPGADPR
jgi:uncharacterized protein (DUF885 family)